MGQLTDKEKGKLMAEFMKTTPQKPPFSQTYIDNRVQELIYCGQTFIHIKTI